MNISSSSLSSLSSVYATTPTAAVSPTDASDATSATSGVDGNSSHTKLSKMGQLMSQLQDLEASDPAKAKQVLSSISDQLSAKASASGTSDPHLQELADKFKQAADTGDLSGLKPTGKGHHMHGPPPSDGDAASSRKAASYAQGADPMAQVESIISSALSSAS